MDIKQIVTLAVIFVAGLVLGNIAGEVTGYAAKGSSITVSPSVLTLDVDKSQQVTLTVKNSVSIKRSADIYEVTPSDGTRVAGVAGIANICQTTYCSKGTYTVKYAIPASKGNYYVKISDKSDREVARGYFTVQ
ncbi:MAG: hypothetical protein AB1571_03560 [Nanoarchaeota archaeon]